MTIRARSKRKRSSSEIAASQVARLRRQAWYEEVVEFYRQGKSIAAIARELHMSPITVRKFVYAGAFVFPICPQKKTKLSLAALLALLATTGSRRL